MPSERYVHFDNIDFEAPFITSRCSVCAREFEGQPRPGEHVDQVLLRIRAEYEAHECKTNPIKSR
jgi:hypothetical protein